ncbi:SAV_915 family protein [Streptomyces sp. NPDC091280]|uniref:SAV_915 family protein n=1 Tax=unclassified Streptomyces TaxID=2593676 RepID=UPI0037F23082
MGEPNRSRLLEYAQDPTTPAAPEPRRSSLLDYAEATPPPDPTTAGRPGPRPGVPPYETPVFVPAHPRYVDTTYDDGRPVRVPFIAYELFAHPTDANGTAAFAFTTLEKLVGALGEAQPWVATSLGPLAEGVAEQGVTVLLDPRVTPGQPNWRPADLAAYAREVR